MTLMEQIMQALAGHDSKKPLRLNALTVMVGDTPEAIRAALATLADQRLVCSVQITRDGKTHDVIWPTGVQAGRVYPFGTIDLSRPPKDHQRAHDQAPAANTQPAQEPPMPRIARPAAQHGAHQPPAKGSVIGEALAALEGLTEDTAATAETMLPLCPTSGSLNSLKTTLRNLARGPVPRIQQRMAYADGQHRAHYWPLVRVPERLRDPAPAATTPPAPTAPAPDRQTAPGNGSDQRTATALGLDEERTRFALWDTGELMITMGDEVFALKPHEVERLYLFLDRTSPSVEVQL